MKPFVLHIESFLILCFAVPTHAQLFLSDLKTANKTYKDKNHSKPSNIENHTTKSLKIEGYRE
jgi:hypothetical protein